MKKKIIWLILLSLLLAGLAAFAFYGEEITEFLFPVKNDWVEKDGVTYYHDEDGDPVTGWFRLGEDSYYLDPALDGAMVTGWLELDGYRYYLDEQGRLCSGWQEIGGETFYLYENGAMATGWITLDDGIYYLNETGNPGSGWLEEYGREYYINQTGMVTVGPLELDGCRYYFDESGIRVTGIVEADGIRCYYSPDGSAAAGWLELEGLTYYVTETGALASGWLELEDGTYYLDENGSPESGWLDQEGSRYYLDADGRMVTGWLKLDNTTYYLQEDGTMATGRLLVDDAARYFTSSGAYVVLVNRWNPVPEDYEVNLVDFNGWKVDASCYDALVQMLSDCPYAYTITSAYRSEASQQSIWDNRMATHQANGYSYNEALALTAAYVATPGTSEHQLGLAVDLSGANAQQWLREHCWEYGFILRYLDGKSDITGIAYERWHFRYVGTELAMELKDTGLCLEEYLNQLANDGSTASNPDNIAETAA